MDKPKVLVTGASGFLGLHLVTLLLDNDYDVHCIVRCESDTKNIDVRSSVFRWDESISGLMKYFEKENFFGVIHLASLFLASHNEDNVESLIHSNIKFGTFILEASTKYDVKWFINTGTFWQHFNNEEYNPVNLYSATKEAFVKIAKYYTEICPEFVFTTIKLSDTFGPKDKRKKIFNLWIENSRNRYQLKMSEGEQIINICYIDDVVSAYLLLANHLCKMNRKRFQFKEFVVSNDELLNLRELAQLFQDATSLKLNISWGAIPYRKREVMVPYNRGEKVPGWSMKHSLRRALKLLSL
jgi:nucleoside-diphosphate-sugar epimerase